MSRFLIVGLCLVALTGAGAGAAPADTGGSKAPIVVSSVEELKAALAPANAGRRIHVRTGTYSVDVALTVPDGATLEGEGVMLGGALPAGFAPGTATRIVAQPSVSGNLLTLGDGSALRGLAVEDTPDRAGNAVAVLSRQASDSVAASIVESTIENPNPAGVGFDGPTGSGILAVTRNPARGADPPPHVDATVALELRRSIVRAERALFAANFASGGRVLLTVRENVVDGVFETLAGISRPDAVTGARIEIDSRNSLYRGAPGTPGWQLVAASTTPIPLGGPWLGSSANHLSMDSQGDRVESDSTGIFAVAAQRLNAMAGTSSHNRVDLSLHGLTIRTTGPGARDLVLLGTLSTGNFTAGDRNTVHVNMVTSTGSGPRSNGYVDAYGPSPENAGTGNRLEFVGSPRSFAASNEGIDPAPPDRFFIGIG